MIKEYDPNKQYDSQILRFSDSQILRFSDSQHHSNADGLRWTCISDGERR